MLTVLTLIGFILICVALCLLSLHFWHSDMLEVLSCTFAVLAGIAIAGILLFLFFNNTSYYTTQAKFVTRYQTIQYKADHIDEYNAEEVKELVDEWNYDLLAAHYEKESPWTNWFNVKNLTEVDYIKLD